MLYGGIVNIITGFTISPVDAFMIAKGVVKVACAGFAGWLLALVLMILGISIIKS